MNTVRKHAIAAAILACLPFPVISEVLVTAAMFSLLFQLAKQADISFTDVAIKAVFLVLAVSAVAILGAMLVHSVVVLIPAIGQVLSALTYPAMAALCTLQLPKLSLNAS
ncbi:MAG: hypothetical protein OXT49_05765 [Gammaproteobacteria bacterium]|nr:hypothetical protein [Gammaproteobacteria bacterium]